MLLDRGYTSHEHLAEVGLIHMNGRLYDPILRSFLMPDNFIQQPENTQNYNRYAYVLNNPLMYNDPSGEAYDIRSPSDTNQQVSGGFVASIVNFFKNPENGEWFRRNAGEIGRFVGRNFESAFNDTTGWIGKQAKSVGKFFSNLFKKSSRYEVPQVAYVNYSAVNTTNTISNNFTAGSTVASGGFKSNYRGTQKINLEGVNKNNSNSFKTESGEGGVASTLAGGWGIAIGEPTPIGEAVMGIATGGAILYYGSSIIDKMNKEINGIMQRAAGPQGYVYELTATRNGPYRDYNTGGYIDLKIGDVWKYGITTTGSRYPDAKVNLVRDGLQMNPLRPGNQMQILIYEKYYIYGHFFMTGSRPPGNGRFK